MKTRSASTKVSRSASRSGAGRSKTLRVSRSRIPAATRTKKPSAAKKSHGANITIDHDEIRRWAESRGGQPAVVKRTHRQGKAEGILRIDFPGFTGEGTLDHVSWDEWFKIFDERGLAFLYQERKANGEPSTFNKLVSRSEI